MPFQSGEETKKAPVVLEAEATAAEPATAFGRKTNHPSASHRDPDVETASSGEMINASGVSQPGGVGLARAHKSLLNLEKEAWACLRFPQAPSGPTSPLTGVNSHHSGSLPRKSNTGASVAAGPAGRPSSTGAPGGAGALRPAEGPGRETRCHRSHPCLRSGEEAADAPGPSGQWHTASPVGPPGARSDQAPVALS